MKELLVLLKKNNMTISTAESCTGGMISAEITNCSGASEVFNLGVVTYSNDAKHSLIKVSNDTLNEFGAVSSQTAIEMADGIRSLADSDISVSVTGIAGPTGGTKDKPVGLVYIGISGKYGSFSYENIFTGSRSEVREKTVSTAIQLLKNYILEFYS